MRDVPSVVWEYIEGLKTHNVCKVASTVSDHLAFISAGRTLDKSQFLDMLQSLYAAFPDWRYEHTEPEVRGDVIAVEWRQWGTHTGTLVMPGIEPIEPAGRIVTIPDQHFFCRVVSEQIVEIRPLDPIPGRAPRGKFRGKFKSLGQQQLGNIVASEGETRQNGKRSLTEAEKTVT